MKLPSTRLPQVPFLQVNLLLMIDISQRRPKPPLQPSWQTSVSGHVSVPSARRQQGVSGGSFLPLTFSPAASSFGRKATAFKTWVDRLPA